LASRAIHLFRGQLHLTAQRGDQRLDLWYQTTPRAFAVSSRYTQVLRQHGFTQLIGLRPDMILRRATDGRERWLLVEGSSTAMSKTAPEPPCRICSPTVVPSTPA
jgi:hypothetical protein